LDDLIAYEGTNPAWIVRRAEILARAGRSDAAREEYARALALLDAYKGTRRMRAFDQLRRRIETALAAAAAQGGNSR
jgi:hypothetical protein